MSFQDDQVFLEKYLDENLNTVLGLRLAEKYISTDNLERAHQTLSEFLETNPNNATAKFLMGEIAFKEGNNDKAKTHYEETIQVDPTFIAAYHRLVTIGTDAGDDAGVSDIYRLLNLVNPMDKKAASEIADGENVDASESDFSAVVLNKYQLSSVDQLSPTADSEDEQEETADEVDSLADELSSKLDSDEADSLDIPLDRIDSDEGMDEEEIETEIAEINIKDDEHGGGEVPFGSESEAAAGEERAATEVSEGEPDTEGSETTEVEAFDIPKGNEENTEIVEGGEDPVEEEDSTREPSESAELDAFGIEIAQEESTVDSIETSEEESSSTEVSDETDESEDTISKEDETDKSGEEIALEDSSDENIEELDKEKFEDAGEAESSGTPDSLDRDDASDEGADSVDGSDETGQGNSTGSTEDEDSDLESSVVDKENRTFEMPPFSEDTLADVTNIEPEVLDAIEESDSDEVDEVEKTDEEETEEMSNDVEVESESNEDEVLEGSHPNSDEGAESHNIPLDSVTDAVSADENIITDENESKDTSEEDDSGTENLNIPIDSAENSEIKEDETPADYESWVDKDVTPDSMTSGGGDASESHKSTFEGLLSEVESSGEIETLELPEESDTELTIAEEQDIRDELDDIYSLTQIEDDEEDISPLQAWFLEKKSIRDKEQEDDVQEKEGVEPDTLTEPMPVPFSGESENESDELGNMEENESNEKWDKFVETAVEKKGEDDSEENKSISSDIDRELKNIFDDVTSPSAEQDFDEANANAPDLSGGVNLNSDLATFTLADIYINQSQFNEALSVLDLLEQKGKNLERVASMREELKVKMEMKNK